MIGNDVIDLDLAAKESNPMRRGWAAKMLSKGERYAVNLATEPTLMAWKIWAVKEAAYKAHVRQGGRRGFYPARIICDLEKGTVLIENHRYWFRIFVSGSRVSAWAATDTLLLDRMVVVKEERITKISGLPFVGTQNALKPASVSHHGQYYEAVTVED